MDAMFIEWREQNSSGIKVVLSMMETLDLLGCVYFLRIDTEEVHAGVL